MNTTNKSTYALLVRSEEKERGALEIPDSPYTAWYANPTAIVAGGERTTFGPVDAYRLMVENVSAVIRGDDGWIVPLDQSRAVADVIDRCFAAAGEV